MRKTINKGRREQRLVKAARQRDFMKVFMVLLCTVFLLSIIAVPAMAWDDLTEGDPFKKGEDLKEGINEGEGEQSGDPAGGGSGTPQGEQSGTSGGLLGDSEIDTTGWAEEGKKTLHKTLGLLCGWLAKLGMLATFYGIIKLGLSFVQDDANAKVVGLTAMISGIMVWSLAMSVNKLFML